MNGKVVGYCSLARRHSIKVLHDVHGYWFEITGDYGVGGYCGTFDEAKQKGLAMAARLEAEWREHLRKMVAEATS